MSSARRDRRQAEREEKKRQRITRLIIEREDRRRKEDLDLECYQAEILIKYAAQLPDA